MQSTIVWAVRLSIGNTRFRPPIEQKRVNRSKPNLAGVTTLGSTFDRQKFWGSIERWRPTRWPFVKLVRLCSSFFPEPAHRSNATFAYHVLCIKRRGSVDTRAFWVEDVAKFNILGVYGPQNRQNLPPKQGHLK